MVGITDLTTETRFHTTLAGWPHSYQFLIEEPATVSFDLWIPAVPAATTDLRAIIVREETRGVAEVARLVAEPEAWEPHWSWLGRHHYYLGPRYQATLEPGLYLLEVSTPENNAPYVLVSGTESTSWWQGLFATLATIQATDRFFGYSPLRVLLSPIVLGLLVTFLFIVGIGRWRRLQS